MPTEQRITDLLSRMTTDEKIDALGTDPTVPRLGVVGTGHVESLHGLALGGPARWEAYWDEKTNQFATEADQVEIRI